MQEMHRGRPWKWLLGAAFIFALVQFGARPGYDHWQSIAAAAREERCIVGSAGDPRSIPRPDGNIKIIRLTDQGTYVDRCELTDALYELHWDRTQIDPQDPVSPRKPGAVSLPKLVVVFVHGWLNDARKTDGDYVEFQSLIERLRKENDGTKGDKKQVTGVYLSWSARSDIPIYQYLTFWNRMQAADRISQSAIVTSAIGAINDALDQSPFSNNQLVLIGHSFGARILQAATAQSLLYGVQQARPRRTNGRYKFIHGVADAIILLNPAFESTMYASIDELRSDGASFDPAQTPLLISIGTSNDSATRYAFPIGQWLAQRASAPEMTTLGNYDAYATHTLHKARSETDCDPKLVGAPLTQGFFAAGLCLDRLPPSANKVTAPNNPFLVVQTTPDIIDNHSGIWGATFSDWLFDFVNEFSHRQHIARRTAVK